MNLLNRKFNNIPKLLFEKLGWTGVIIIIASILIFIYGKTRQNNLVNNASYTKGVSLGIQTSVYGSSYLYYSFHVDNQTYKGSVTDDFCEKCSTCCQAGNTVIVEYERGNPENNDLVTKLPDGRSL